jgi:integrase
MARREHQLPNVLRQDGTRPYYYIRYRVRVLNQKTTRFERKERWHTLGYCDEITKREAERARDRVMAGVNNQVFTLQEQILFGDFVKIYESRHMPTLAVGPREKYRSLLKNHILPEFGTLSLCDIGTELVQGFLNAKKDQGLSWWTRNDLKGIVFGVFTKASDWGYWTGRNPVLRTTLGPRRTARKKYGLTDDQIVALINELPEILQLMVATAVSTGMRVSELCGLKWGSVDLSRGLVWVQETYFRGEVGETKTEESHRALALGRLTPAFERLRPRDAKPSDYVFHNYGEPMDDRDILRRFIRPAAEQLGLYFPGFGWRTFRRLNITAIQDGPNAVNVFEAMRQAGHTKPETTLKYTLLRSEQRRKAILGLQERWLPPDCAGILRECGNARTA